MPTYVYACDDCDAQFEQFQRFSDAPLTQCPRCEGGVRRVFQPVGIVFKGSGWYVTDSRQSSAKGESAAKGETAAKGESAAKDESPAKGETAAKDESTASSSSSATSESGSAEGSSGGGGKGAGDSAPDSAKAA